MVKRIKKDEWESNFQKWKAEKDSKAKPAPIQKKEKLEEGRTEKNKSKQETIINSKPNKFLIFLAFAIPALILIYGLYINYLPFGWEKAYELTIDSEGLVLPLSGEVYVTNIQGRKLLSLPEGVNGQVNVVVEPGVVLENATVNVEIDGQGVYLATDLETNLSEIDWDYVWDFTNDIPLELEGNANHILILNGQTQGCAKFDATKEQTLFLPNSQDMFESVPMSIYVKWKPSAISEVLGNYQQIIGHYNWEIWQGKESVQFRVGRMNDAEGPSYSTSYKITPEFFEKEHELLAIYSPDKINGEGYIELWVDRNFVQRASINSDIIYRDYNGERDLNFGRTPHNYDKYPFFDGCIYEARMVNYAIKENKVSGIIKTETSPITIPIIGNGKLNSVKVNISK